MSEMKLDAASIAKALTSAKEQLEKAGITPAKIASMLGTDATKIEKVMNGVEMPDAQMVSQVVKAVTEKGIDLSDLTKMAGVGSMLDEAKGLLGKLGK